MAEGLVLPATHLQLFISTWLQHTQLKGEREDTQVRTHLISCLYQDTPPLSHESPVYLVSAHEEGPSTRVETEG